MDQGYQDYVDGYIAFLRNERWIDVPTSSDFINGYLDALIAHSKEEPIITEEVTAIDAAYLDMIKPKHVLIRK